MQCILDQDAIMDAVPKIIRGRCYDNGVLLHLRAECHLSARQAQYSMRSLKSKADIT